MKMSLIALLLFLLLLSVGAFLFLRGSYNVAYSLAHPARNLAESTPNDVGIDNWEDVRFRSGELALTGWFIPPAPEANGSTLIVVHGWSANRASLLGQVAMLHRHGYGAFVIELRNSGLSEGDVSTWGYAEAADVQAAFDYLLTRTEVNPGQIGLLGFSAGGATVIRAAAQIPEIKVVIAQSTYTSFVDNLPAITKLLKSRLPTYAPLVLWLSERQTTVPLREIRPINDLAQLEERPIMFIHGTSDSIVDVSHSQQLFEAAKEPKALYLVPDASHEAIYSIDRAEFEKQVISFLTQYFHAQ